MAYDPTRPMVLADIAQQQRFRRGSRHRHHSRLGWVILPVLLGTMGLFAWMAVPALSPVPGPLASNQMPVAPP